MRYISTFVFGFAVCVAGPACDADDAGDATGPSGAGGKGDCLDGDCELTEVAVSTETISVSMDVEVVGPAPENQFTTSYAPVGRRDVAVNLVTFTNASGLSMSFVVDEAFSQRNDIAEGDGGAPFGARLYAAELDGEPLLYTNPSVKRSPNWGPVLPSAAGRASFGGDDYLGWLGLGGAESCFPVHEHGYYNATNWSYAYSVNDDGSATFRAWVDADRYDPKINGVSTRENLDVEVSYTLPLDGHYWKTSITVSNPDDFAKPYQYWHNYMLPAGSDTHKHTVELLLDASEVSQIEVHSTGDDALKRADGQGEAVLGDGGHAVHPWSAGGRLSKVHGPDAGDNVRGWLGLFNISAGRAVDARNMISRYGMFDHDRSLGLGMVSTSGERTIFPKAFGGPGIGTGNWTEAGTRYVEFWYSTNTRSFWEYPQIGPRGSATHETYVFPFTETEQWQAFDATAPGLHDAWGDVEPPPPGGDEGGAPGCGPVLEDFRGASVDARGAVDASGCGGSCPPVSGTLAQGWEVWFDGGWGGERSLFHDASAGTQTFSTATGSYGIRTSVCDIGGREVDITHAPSFSDGRGWYEVWAGETMLIKYEDGTSPSQNPAGCTHEPGRDRCRVPAGSDTLSFKIGTQHGTASATVSSIVVN